MTTYGYIRTSRDQEPGHPGSDPHVQHRQLVEAGVDHARIYADVATSGAKDYNSRDQWHVLDQQLAQGDVLWLPPSTDWDDAISRPCGRSTTCSAAASGCSPWPTARCSGPSTWTPTPDSPKAFMGNVLASMAAYVASQERQNISRRTRAGLDAAREKGVELGRPRRLTNEQLIAIRQDVEEGMPVAAVARKYGVPRSTLRIMQRVWQERENDDIRLSGRCRSIRRAVSVGRCERRHCFFGVQDTKGSQHSEACCVHGAS